MNQPRKQYEDIYSSACIQQLEQAYCSSRSAAVVSSCLVSSHGLGARVISHIYHGGRRAVYTATVAAMLANNMTVPAYGATVTVSAGKTSAGLVLSSGTAATVSTANVYGTTEETQAYLGGTEIIYNGGVANSTTINAGGSQVISSGGVASGTRVSAGTVTLHSGGSAVNVSQGLFANVNVSVTQGDNETYLTGTNAHEQTFGLADGVASGFIINSGGVHTVNAGASSIDLTQSLGGIINVAVDRTDGTYISGHTEGNKELLLENGVASNFMVYSGANHTVNAGASSLDVVQYAGGNIDAAVGQDGTKIIGTNAAGQTLSLSNGVASNFILYSGGSQVINDGGVADTTTVNRGGSQVINNGGVADTTIISSGGNQVINNGGVANSTTIDNYGRQAINEGGVANSTTINTNGSQVINDGGVADTTIISSGGNQVINNGGVANNTTIDGYSAYQFISSGGEANSTTVNRGGQVISNGGVANSVTVAGSSAYQTIHSGGIASHTTLSGLGRLTVSVGGSAVDVTQLDNGIIRTTVSDASDATFITGTNANGTFSLQNGVASNFLLTSSSYLAVSSGGQAFNITQQAGGNINAVVIGEDTHTSVTGTNASGQALSLSNGVASNFILYSGGSQVISNGGVANSTTINTSGSQVINNGGVADGTTLMSGAIQTLAKGGSSIHTIVEEGVLVNMTVVAGDTTVFDGTYGSGAETFSYADGVANNFIISRGGFQNVSAGGSSFNLVQHASGHVNVMVDQTDGTVVSGTNASGENFSLRDGVASNFILYAGGSHIINSGGSSLNLTQVTGGRLVVDHTITAGDTTYVTGTHKGSAMLIENGVVSNIGVYGSNTRLTLSGGAQAQDVWVQSGRLNILDGATASNTHVLDAGSEIISSGGIAKGTTISGIDNWTHTAYQVVSSGGVASATTINRYGSQVISNGGIANSTTINAYGSQSIYNQGLANNTTVNGGYQFVGNGGIANSTTVNSGTQFVDSGGVANNPTINAGGVQRVDNGGQANNVTLSSGGKLEISAGGQGLNVVQYSGGVLGADIVQGSGTWLTGVNQDGVSFRVENGVGYDFIISSGGVLRAYSSGATSHTQIAGGSLYISNGSSVDTVITQGGEQTLMYGTADGTTVVSGNQILSAYGYGRGTLLSGAGAVQTLINGGTGNDTIVRDSATQNVSSGGVANNAVLSNGTQNIYDMGIASGGNIYAGGSQIINQGGKAIGTHILQGGEAFLLSAGIASNTEIASGGLLDIAQGGQALNLVQLTGGNIQVDIDGTDMVTSVTGTNQNGQNILLASGVGSNFIINSGTTQEVYNNGLADGTVLSGGVQNLSAGGSAIRTVLDGGIQNVTDGTLATSTTVNSGGRQVVSTGGSANYTTVNSSGTQALYGGTATHVTLNPYAIQEIGFGGIANDTTVNNHVTQRVVEGGTANRSILQDGGIQEITSDGTANSTIVLANGVQNLSAGGRATGTKIETGGVQNIYNDGIASGTVLSGGIQNLMSGGSAADTVVNNGGVQNITDGATATGTTVNSEGHQIVSAGGTATDTTLVTGVQDVISGGVAHNTTLYADATQNIYAGARVHNTTVSGCTVNLYESGTIDGYTGASGALKVYGNGVISGTMSLSNEASVQMQYEGEMNTLSVENLAVNNATIGMNVNLDDQTGDQLLVASSYEGNTKVQITNVATSAKATEADGIEMISFADTAAVNGTFDLVGGQYDEGGYVYKLLQGTAAGEGNNYYLRNTKEYTDTFKTMLNIPQINVMLARTGMNSLQKRLGELQDMNNTSKKQGVWVRSYYKDMTVNDLVKTDLNLFGAEAGYDWLFREEEPTKLYAGVMLGYIQANHIKTEKNNGSYDKGDGSSPSVGIYATLVNEDGWFVDLAARNFWTKLDMTNHAASGKELLYKPERNVFTTSLEIGKNFVSNARRDQYVRIRPTVALNYMNASSDKTNVKNGIGRLKYEGVNYLNTKAGILLSYNKVRKNGLLIEPLVELAYRYQFMGKGDVLYGGAQEESDLTGGTVEANVGLNMQLTDNLYWYTLGSYEGGNKEKGWGVYAGIRYSFGNTKPSKSESLRSKQTAVVSSAQATEGSASRQVEPLSRRTTAQTEQAKVKANQETAKKNATKAKAKKTKTKPVKTKKSKVKTKVKPVKKTQVKKMSLLDSIEKGSYHY